MKSEGSCPKCGSQRLVTDVKVLDRDYPVGGELTVQVSRRPSAWLFKGKQSTHLTACVCADCGLTEFYAHEPEVLLRAQEE